MARFIEFDKDNGGKLLINTDNITIIKPAKYDDERTTIYFSANEYVNIDVPYDKVVEKIKIYAR